jgi:hypothetical protein
MKVCSYDSQYVQVTSRMCWCIYSYKYIAEESTFEFLQNTSFNEISTLVRLS